MTREEKLKSLIGEARSLREKGTALDDAEVKRAGELVGEIRQLQDALNASKRVAEQFQNLAPETKRDEWGTKDHNVYASARIEKARGFIDAYRQQKAEGIPSSTVTVEYGGPLVTDPKHTFSLGSLVNSVQADTPSGSFLRQTDRDLNAAPVKLGEVKPESSFGFEYVPWELSTLAHTLKPSPRQWFADVNGLSDFVVSELAYGLDEATNSYVLNGGATEAGNTVTGVLNTPGIATVPFADYALTTIRTALRTLEDSGYAASGIALSAADWQALELSVDGTGRPLLTSLGAQSAARQLWGVPVTIVQGLPAGTAVVADWRAVTLFNRGSVEITQTEFGTYKDANGAAQDLYTHNLVRFRAEVRRGVLITALPAVLKVALTAPAQG